MISRALGEEVTLPANMHRLPHIDLNALPCHSEPMSVPFSILDLARVVEGGDIAQSFKD